MGESDVTHTGEEEIKQVAEEDEQFTSLLYSNRHGEHKETNAEAVTNAKDMQFWISSFDLI